MSENFKKMLNDDELYAKIIEKIQPNKFDITEGWIPKSRFKEKVDEISKMNEKLSTYESQLGDVEKLLKDNKELKDNFTNLDVKYKTELENKNNEILNITKISKVENKLKDEGAKFTDLLMGKIDLSKLTIDGDNLLGLDDTVKGLKEKYADLFVTTNTNTNQQTGSTGSSNNEGDSNNDFNSMDWENVAKKFI